MLVIRRRIGESLLIGEDIEVQVLETSGAQVKLGIRAPRTVSVVRKEIRTVSEQNRMSAKPISGENLEQILENLKKPSTTPIRPV